VLVIEDNLDEAHSLRSVLESLGHVVQTANDGRSGIARAREFQPEIVLCDLGLSALDGHAVAAALRDDAQRRGVVLVAMTGYAHPDARRRSAEAGFHDHLAKPPSLERLEEVLARAALPLA
jgi:CheY-like chemotaxis protein